MSKNNSVRFGFVMASPKPEQNLSGFGFLRFDWSVFGFATKTLGITYSSREFASLFRHAFMINSWLTMSVREGVH